MLIRIDRIPSTGRCVDVEIDQTELDEALGHDDRTGTRWIVPASATLQLALGKGTLDIEGGVRFRHQQECARCLEAVVRDEEAHFRLTKLLGAPPPSPHTHPIELTDETIDDDYHEGEEIDLTAVAIEQIALETPMTVLCKESCRGLCPRCGTNLNERTCDCDPRPVDPRFAVLAQLTSTNDTKPDPND